MLQSCIKYFFIIFCAFYLYRKLLNLKITKKLLFLQTVSSLVLSILTHYLRLYFMSSNIFLLTIFFISIIYYSYKHPMNITLVTSIISIGCSYVLFLMAVFIFVPISLILLQLFYSDTPLYEISFTIMGCIQMLIAIILFRFKRLKNGMPFLQQGANDIGVFISISLLIATSFFNANTGENTYILIPAFFVAISGMLIFFWWKHKLTETYLTKLNERKIQEYEKRIEALQEQHDTLAKIIHKDNKLIPTMVFELQNVLTQVGNHLNEEDRTAVTHALHALNTLAQERKGLIQFDESKAKAVYSTGSKNIDSLLKYLSAKAYSEQIMFEVTITANVQHILPHIISEADFRTIVADLVENAFIAVKSETKRNVLFYTRIENNLFYVDIYDSGTPFAKEVLENMGKKAITTHKEEGGSGIGYMSTFEILNRCHGGLHIDENLGLDSYTKKVSIYFPLDDSSFC